MAKIGQKWGFLGFWAILGHSGPNGQYWIYMGNSPLIIRIVYRLYEPFGPFGPSGPKIPQNTPFSLFPCLGRQMAYFDPKIPHFWAIFGPIFGGLLAKIPCIYDMIWPGPLKKGVQKWAIFGVKIGHFGVKIGHFGPILTPFWTPFWAI